jgi:hypothetical protein
MVAKAEKIFSSVEKMVAALENIFWVPNKIFSTPQKMVEIGRRYKYLYINVLIIV